MSATLHHHHHARQYPTALKELNRFMTYIDDTSLIAINI